MVSIRDNCDNDDVRDTILARHQRQHNLRQASADSVSKLVYSGCNFIYGSAVEVERLWLVANYIPTFTFIDLAIFAPHPRLFQTSENEIFSKLSQ